MPKLRHELGPGQLGQVQAVVGRIVVVHVPARGIVGVSPAALPQPRHLKGWRLWSLGVRAGSTQQPGWGALRLAGKSLADKASGSLQACLVVKCHGFA